MRNGVRVAASWHNRPIAQVPSHDDDSPTRRIRQAIDASSDTLRGGRHDQLSDAEQHRSTEGSFDVRFIGDSVGDKLVDPAYNSGACNPAD